MAPSQNSKGQNNETLAFRKQILGDPVPPAGLGDVNRPRGLVGLVRLGFLIYGTIILSV